MASPESSMVNKGKPHPPDLDDFLEFFQAGTGWSFSIQNIVCIVFFWCF